MVHKRNKLLRITSAVLIFILAFVLMYATRVSFPSTEASVHEQCFIEDCAFGVRQAGFPFRAYELTRYLGLNCDADSKKSQCSTEQLKSPYLVLLNYLIYVAVLAGLFLTVRKLKFSAQGGSSV
jgi:hypothetical protein